MRAESKRSWNWRAVALVVVGLVVLAAVVEWSDRRSERIRGDLTKFSLAASKVLAADGNPYSKQTVGRNYKYLPTNAVLLFPLTKVDTYRAQGIWFAMNVGLLIWVFVLHGRLLRPLRVPRWVFIATFFICMRLIWHNIKLGQWNTSVYCLSFIGLYLISRQKHVRGALALALGCVLKFTPCIFLPMFLLRRQWRTAALMVAGIIAWVFLPPLLVVGPTKTNELFRTFFQKSEKRYENISRGPNVYSVSVRSTVFRLTYPATMKFDDGRRYTAAPINLGPKWADRLGLAISLLFAAVTIGATWKYAGSRLRLRGLGKLALFGNWYMLVTICSPGLREAQMIAVLTAVFTIAASLALSPGKPPRWTWWSFIIAAIALNSPTEIIEDGIYNELLQVYGVLAVAQVLLWAHTLVILREESRLASSATDDFAGDSTNLISDHG